MGLLDDEEFLKKRKPNLLADVRQLQRPSDPYLRQQYPAVFGGLAGLVGMAPDEMSGSILDPNTARVRAGAQYGFPVGTALQVAPMVGPAGRAAAAGARALGPTAVRMGEGYLQSKGLMPQLDVYHGSPHKFDRFDASKIGTGEGAQAYGHGIYTAENPGIAQGYADRLGGGQFGSTSAAKGSTADRLSAMFDNDGSNFRKGSRDISIIAKNLAEKTKVDANGLVHHQFKDGSEWIGSQSGWDVANTEKNLYKVDLPDKKIAGMLDWDRPLSEQPEFVRNTLINDMGVDDNWATVAGDSSGGALYNSMVKEYGSPEAVSAALMNQGIPGIKYLDATSRGAGTGTRNFVTFPGEEQSLTILERNGQPLALKAEETFAGFATPEQYAAAKFQGSMDAERWPAAWQRTGAVTPEEILRGKGIVQPPPTQRDKDLYLLESRFSGYMNASKARQFLENDMLKATKKEKDLLRKYYDASGKFIAREEVPVQLERNGQPMIARTQQQDATPDLLQYQQMLDEEERRKSAGLLFR